MRISIAILALTVVTAAAQEADAIRLVGEAELTGKTYRKLIVSGARLQTCMTACEEDLACAGFTLSPTPEPSSSACELKSTAGTTIANRRGYISGIRREAAAVREAAAAREHEPHAVARIPSAEGQQGAVTRQPMDAETMNRIREQLRIPPDAVMIGSQPLPNPQGRPLELPPVPPLELPPTPPKGAPTEGVVTRPVPALPPTLPAPPLPPALPPAPQLAGNWSVQNGDAVDTVRIAQSGDSLTFIDQSDRKVEARLANGKVVVDAWKMEAEILKSGRELRWSNGSVWTR